MTCDHRYEHSYYCDECYYNGQEDYYHDQCVICGEVA